MIGAKELLKFSDKICILYVEDDQKLRERKNRENKNVSVYEI